MKRIVSITVSFITFASGCMSVPSSKSSGLGERAAPSPPVAQRQAGNPPPEATIVENANATALARAAALTTQVPANTANWPATSGPTNVPMNSAAVNFASNSTAGGRIERLPQAPPTNAPMVALANFQQPKPLESQTAPIGSASPTPATPQHFNPATNGNPQAPAGVSLEELSSITENNNPKLRSALAEVEAAKGDRVQAGLYPNPKMETNNPEIWAGRDSQLNFGFQQDWIVKGKMRLDKAAADQKVRVKAAAYVVERMRVLTVVRSQYFRAVAARERLRNAEQIQHIARTANDVAQELLKSGERALTDALLLKTEYERAKVTYENARTFYSSELRQLAAATGVPNMVIHEVSGSLTDRPPLYDEPYIRDFLQNRSAPVVMAQAEAVRRQILLHREEVEPYPNFRFGPAYAASTAPGSDRQFWFTMIFDIPVWNLNQGNIRAARADFVKAEADLESTRNELVSDLAETHARHQTAQLTLSRIQNSILPNAAQTQRLVQEGYAKGQLDVNRLLEAQRSLLEARRDQIDAYEEAWTTAAKLAGYLQFEQFP